MITELDALELLDYVVDELHSEFDANAAHPFLMEKISRFMNELSRQNRKSQTLLNTIRYMFNDQPMHIYVSGVGEENRKELLEKLDLLLNNKNGVCHDRAEESTGIK